MKEYRKFTRKCPNAEGDKPTIWHRYPDGTEECQCWWCHQLKKKSESVLENKSHADDKKKDDVPD